MITLTQLNENQRRAAEWTEGPLLVLAGPGSGKTAVLTIRVANLIKSSPDDTFRVLGLTFTVKAANEMQARIEALLGDRSRRIQIKTFHSFCADLLRQHGSHIGLTPDFSIIIDEKDRMALIKKIAQELDVSQSYLDEPEQILKRIDTMFTNGIDASDLHAYFKEDQEKQCQELQSIFSAYLKALKESNQLDFGAMLHFARILLQTKERVSRQVRTVYQYICIDEFQDTNISQYKILRLLAISKVSNLFVVADDDQIIFQWNGADPKRLEELKNDYSLEIIQLPDNYRCPQQIVKLANNLIAYNRNRVKEKMQGVSHSAETGIITIQEFPDFNAELDGLAIELQNIPINKRDTCLIIARSNNLLAQAKSVLNINNLSAEIVLKQQDYSDPLILTMYYSLKLANLPSSRSLLNKLCAVASKANPINISAEEIATIAEVENAPFLRSFFTNIAQSSYLKPISEVGISKLCDNLKYKEFCKSVLDYFDSMCAKDEFPDYETDKDNWLRIYEQISRNYATGISLHALLQEMDLSPKSKTLQKDCVRMQTVHTAKGVEYAHVYIIGLAEDQFPTYFASKQGEFSKAMEEERRNCFVAITRASHTLYMSYATQYLGWHKKPSRFLSEMIGDNYE